MSAKVSASPRLPESRPDLRVGGLARLSTCDWPGELVATVFCQGCAWDCAYCHNASLRPAQVESLLSWDGVLEFLVTRRGLLDAVVFSGGEPTLQPALLDAVKTVRSLGFRIGLHTAGMVPLNFARLLPLVDWVGFDVKAPVNAYARITGVEDSGARAMESLRLLLASGIEYEVRTTLHPALLSLDEMKELRDQLFSHGVTHYAVQRFRAEGTRPNRLPPLAELSQFALPADFGEGFSHFRLR